MTLGIHATADGTVDDAWPDRPAYVAGIANGMKIVAVNGRKYSTDEMKRAIAGSKDRKDAMTFIVDNAGYFSTVTVDYHGGARYSHLERAGGSDDILTKIAAPRVKP